MKFKKIAIYLSLILAAFAGGIQLGASFETTTQDQLHARGRIRCGRGGRCWAQNAQKADLLARRRIRCGRGGRCWGRDGREADLLARRLINCGRGRCAFSESFIRSKVS